MTESIPPDGYDDWSVPEVESHVEESDYSNDELDSLLGYEQENKDRNGVEGAIDEGRDDGHASENEFSVSDIEEPELAEVSAPEVDLEESNDSDEEETSDETEDSQFPPSDTKQPEEVVVSISDPTRVSVAGLVFANPDKTKTVRYNRRIEQAVEDGHLKLHTDL